MKIKSLGKALSFRGNFLALALIAFSFSASAQVYQTDAIYGRQIKRYMVDTTLIIPTVCGVPTLRSVVTKKAAIAFDSCNHKLYFYDPKTLAWDIVAGGVGPGSTDTTYIVAGYGVKIDSLLREYTISVDSLIVANKTYVNNKDALKVNFTDTALMVNNYKDSIITHNTRIITNTYNNTLKLNISDTAGKWVGNIISLNDSTLRVFEGSGFTDVPVLGKANNAGGGGSGTVTSVATGLGLSGGTITTTGTVVLDTSASVVLTRQRAANTFALLGGVGWSLTGNTGTDTSVNFFGNLDSKPFQFKTKGVRRLVFDTLGNAIFGFNTLLATATPVNVSFGGTFGTSTPGNAANLKWNMYSDGSAENSFGIGMSSGLMEFQSGNLSDMAFFVNHTSAARLRISTNGNVLIGPLATNLPQALLSLGSSIANSKFLIYDGGGGYGMGIGSSQFRFHMGTSADRFSFLSSAAGTELFTIDGSGRVGIGNASPNASAKLDIVSTTQGVLLPRLTTTQINAIAAPADGLTVYNTTEQTICFYSLTGLVWKKVTSTNL